MNILQILKKYPNLPHKLKVKFALECANGAKHFIKQKDVLEILNIIQLWLEDRISLEDIVKVADKTYELVLLAQDNKDSRMIIYAIYTIVSSIVYNKNVYYHYATEYIIKVLDGSEDEYGKKLLEMIDYLTDLEKLIYLK